VRNSPRAFRVAVAVRISIRTAFLHEDMSLSKVPFKHRERRLSIEELYRHA